MFFKSKPKSQKTIIREEQCKNLSVKKQARRQKLKQRQAKLSKLVEGRA